jgi:hypothetical protein
MAEEMNWGKRGQVTVWVIVAIAIVAIVGFIFFISGGPGLLAGPEINPQAYIEKCMKDATAEALDKMLPQGGFVEPGENSKIYNDVKVAYLCYIGSYYYPCINQHPAYISEIKTEILNYVKPKAEQCFSDMKTQLEKNGYSVSFDSPLTMNVELMPGKARVGADRKLSLRKQGEARTFDEFKSEVVNPIYDLANVATRIVNDEARYCSFEYVGYMAVYPSFEIKLYRMSDSTEIYTIKDKDSGKELNIAIRGCASLPGR